MTQTKEQAQLQLQNALTTTFLANLAFLSEYDNELYHRVDELSRMIENGTYKEKYALEFIMEDGDFDIYDIVNDKYLYYKNPKEVNDKLVRNVEFDIKQSIFNLGYYFLNKNQHNIDLNNRFSFDMQDANENTKNQINEYLNITKDYLENKKKRLKNINKFIFLGTLLGRHIPRIAEKIDAKVYLVLERNLEIFRLSLFTVDYTVLAKNGVIFSIMDDETEEEKKIEQFLDILNTENYLLKFSTTTINIDQYNKNLLSILSMNNPLIYDHNRRLYIHFNRTTKRIEDKYKFIEFKKLEKDLDYFKDKPVLYIAAGPSLDENIEWIKENQDRFYIVCIGRALGKLLENDIRVDIVTTIDEQDKVEEWQFDDEVISKISKNTLLFASAITSTKVLNKFNKNNIYLLEMYRTIFKNNFAFNGYSVGEVTLHILTKLNFKEIYMIGLDLTLNQDTGETHANTNNGSSKKLELKYDVNNLFQNRNSILKVKGNFKDELLTTSLFHSSIHFLNRQILPTISNDVNIYNLSENGAYFISTTPTKVKDVNLNSLKPLEKNPKEIKEVLDKYSKIKLDGDDKNIFEKGKENLNDFLLTEFKEFFSKDFNNFNELIENFIIFNNKQNSNSLENELLKILLEKYYLLILPYLNYHFNDKKIKDEKKKVSKIKIVLEKQLKIIFDDYLYCLERLVK